jgi:hypothetical protein
MRRKLPLARMYKSRSLPDASPLLRANLLSSISSCVVSTAMRRTSERCASDTLSEPPRSDRCAAAMSLHLRVSPLFKADDNEKMMSLACSFPHWQCS